MTRGTVGERWVRGSRAVVRALCEDLLTVDPERLPGVRAPRWLDWRPALLVPLVLIAAMLVVVGAEEYGSDYGLGSGLGVLFACVQAAALVAGLYFPVPAWWAATLVMAMAAQPLADGAVDPHPWAPGALLPHAGVPYPWTSGGLGVQAGLLFLLALRVRLRAAAMALVITVLAGIVLMLDAVGSGYSLGSVLLAVPVLVGATVLGAALRGRQVARTELSVQEELTAEERARRTLLEERHRIARELHDVVAHHMSVISIQAQVARHLVADPPDALRENLAGIRQSAVEALTELRRVLGVLRSEEAATEGGRHAPQPTLAQLDELLAGVRGAGVTVTAHTTGERRPLPPGVELSAFRIVQEALSNTMRHAPGAEVRVETGYHPAALTIRVTNTPPARPAAPSPGAGHGLLGMRERTAMLGGDLATGPTPDGGYEVTAVLPTHRTHPCEDSA
ncbi:sensor histidine kinase [Streptomyces sp. NPDC045431]|uniref:sensor histidine kinase n=1 Tax=Streptomyces sp. NPDC045431 TaxID=3155613 RepID=UPI0033ECA8F1